MLSFPKQEDNRNGIDHYDSNTVHAWNALNKQIFFFPNKISWLQERRWKVSMIINAFFHKASKDLAYK